MEGSSDSQTDIQPTTPQSGLPSDTRLTAANVDTINNPDVLLNLREALETLPPPPPTPAQLDPGDIDSIDNETDAFLPQRILHPNPLPPIQQPQTPLIQGLLARSRTRNGPDVDLLSDHATNTDTDGGSSYPATGASSAVSVTKLPLYYASMRMAPIAFFYGLAVGILSPVFTELLKARVCQIELRYAESTCLELTDVIHKTENDNVVALTSHYSFLVSLVGSLPCAVFAIFTGSWSDHFGRKLPMMIPFCGMCLSAGLLILFAHVPTHPAYLLFVPLLSAMFGGWVISAAAIFSYIGDYSSPKNLALDLAVFDGILSLAAYLGVLVGGVMYGLYGFTYPFALYGGLIFLTILYILLGIRDRRVLSRELHRSGCQTLFSTKSIRENKVMLVKERTGHTRLHILILLVSVSIAAACSTGNGSINQLFFETPPLSWTTKNYTVFSCITGVISSLIMIASIPILKKLFNLKDTAIGIIGVISAILSYLALSATEQTWVAVVSAVVGSLSGLQYVAARSLLSNLVDRDERGKMMSVIASLQALVPILGSFIFTSIFSATVGWWPGFPFAMAGMVMLIVLSGFCYVDMQRRGFEYGENSESRYAKISN